MNGVIVDLSGSDHSRHSYTTCITKTDELITHDTKYV